MSDFKRDVFEPELAFVMEESAEVDGVHILGKVRGQFFVPEGVSRNKRYYSAGLWEKALNDTSVKERLATRRMFGTISHEQKLDDTALLEGKVSHVLTGLSIDGKKGIGEALILNTPAGKILNTVLRAGCKLFVSSRADGDYKGTFQGIPAVDPDKYKLETFDFVIEPGFLQANPSLVESLKDDVNYLFKEELETPPAVPAVPAAAPNEHKEEPIPKIDDPKEEKVMEKLVESLTTDKVKLTEQLNQVLGSLEVEKAEKVSLVSENARLQEQLTGAQTSAATMALYERLGTPADLENSLDAATKLIERYKELGSVEEIEKIFAVMEEMQNKQKGIVETLGTPEQVSEALDAAEARLKAYETFGTPEELDEAFTVAEKTILEYQERGSLEEIDGALDKLEEVAGAMESTTTISRTAALAKELGVSEEKIKSVYGKIEEDAIRELFSGIVAKPAAKSDDFVERFSKTDDDKKDEKIDVPAALQTTRGSRMMENFSK